MTNHEAHHGIGYCLLRQKKYNESIEHFLNAIGLRFNYPVAHYHLAEAFYHTGQFDEALRAYEVCLKMEPGMNKARLRISKILNEHMQQQESASEVQTAITENLAGTIYVVSGLPRSGTSLMMQMLVTGGMTPFTDEKRIADENNPKGYFEHEAVLRLKRDSSWLNLANGKVVKIVSPLLTSLPPRYKYKIIFMERDIIEVMNSQQVMLQKSGKTNRSDFSVKVLNTYKENLEQIANWSEKNKNFVEIVRIPFESLFNNPQESISNLVAFLQLDLNTENMLTSIDPSLYRTKINVNNV